MYEVLSDPLFAMFCCLQDTQHHPKNTKNRCFETFKLKFNLETTKFAIIIPTNHKLAPACLQFESMLGVRGVPEICKKTLLRQTCPQHVPQDRHNFPSRLHNLQNMTPTCPPRASGTPKRHPRATSRPPNHSQKTPERGSKRLFKWYPKLMTKVS